jgi:hypothetical protein
MLFFPLLTPFIIDFVKFINDFPIVCKLVIWGYRWILNAKTKMMQLTVDGQ